MSPSELQIILSAVDAVKAQGSVGATLAAGFYFRDVITEIFKKVTYPAADAIGNLAGKIIELGTFQSPHSRDAVVKIGKAIWKICELHKDKGPDAFVDSISPEIAVPLFNKLSYFQDGDLRDLLTALLASSMLKDGQVHPTVIALIDRLSSSEAKMLNYFAKNGKFGPWPSITLKAATSSRNDGVTLPGRAQIRHLSHTQKEELFTKFVDGNSGQSGFRDIGAQHVSDMLIGGALSTTEDVFFCSANLRFLGIVEPTEGYIDNKVVYLDLIERAYEYVDRARAETGNEPIIERHKLSITSLGKKTIDAFNL
jgi:Abortive infection alpha